MDRLGTCRRKSDRTGPRGWRRHQFPEIGLASWRHCSAFGPGRRASAQRLAIGDFELQPESLAAATCERLFWIRLGPAETMPAPPTPTPTPTPTKEEPSV